MSFIRKVKVGKYVYLQEVKSIWENGKSKHKFLRTIGKEVNDKKILNGSIESSQISRVAIYGQLLVLNEIAKQIKLHEILGKYSSEILSMVYSHCVDSRSLNKMRDWFGRTELNHLLNLNELTERRLIDSLDHLESDERSEILQNKIFNAVNEKYQLTKKSFFYDVTNIYFFGSNCAIAKRSKSKEGGYKRLVQIGLAVTDEGIPVFHKVFSGNVFDARTLFDVMRNLSYAGIKFPFLIWDRGVSSGINVSDAKKLGFQVICGLANKGNLPEKIEPILRNENFMSTKNRVQLKESSFYVSTKNYKYDNVNGYLYVCFNPKQQVEQREKRLKDIFEAKAKLQKNKLIDDSLKPYFSENGNLLESKIKEQAKYDGISIIFSTKKMEISEVVRKYFDKDTVEKAFACLKGVVKIRPVRNWITDRVKAHIFICYLSYLLLSILDYKLKKKNVKVSSTEAIDQLETVYKIYLKDFQSGNEFVKTVVLTKLQEQILKSVNKNLTKPSN